MGTLVGIAVCVGNKRAVATVPTEVEPTGIMTFADPAMQALCAKTWGDGTNITYEQARAVTEIPKNWAKDNTTITSFNEIKYFKNLVYIRERAFTNCSNLVINEISLPNLLSIELSAFANCTALGCELLNLPSCETLGTTVFYNSSIKRVVMPKLKTIADSYKDYGCFQKIPNLEIVTLRDIEYIGDYSFKDATKLVLDSIEYPNLTRIGIGAFANCTFKLNKAILPNCKKIDKYAFLNCTSMNADINLPLLTSVGVRAFHNSGIVKITSLGSVTSLPDGDWTGSVYAGVFHGCTQLKTVILPDSLKTIGIGSFARCSSLTQINIPEGVKSLGQACFGRCSALESIELPSTVTAIGPSAFQYCTGLIRVSIIAGTPPSLGSSAFANCPALTGIYVPDDSVEAYKTATNWSAYANIILPLSQFNG